MPTADPVIIFHPGFHKTGTTSLQTALHAPTLTPDVIVQTRATSPTLPRDEIRRLKRDMLAAGNLTPGDGDFFAVPSPDAAR